MTAESMSLVKLLAQGGWAMVPIYLCSVLGLAVFLKKLIEFKSAGVGRTEILEVIQGPLLEGDLDAVEQVSRAEGTPLGRVLAVAARAVQDTPKRAEEEVARVATAELQSLERFLGLLAFIAQVSPLFGLLGTVLGMVDLFSGLEAAGQSVEASTLSAGIWKALLTTAAGLVVAIPALAGHAWLTSQADALKLHMQNGAQHILNQVLGKA